MGILFKLTKQNIDIRKKGGLRQKSTRTRGNLSGKMQTLCQQVPGSSVMAHGPKINGGKKGRLYAVWAPVEATRAI